MSSFFLLSGTVLFFVGLGCLIIVFAKIVGRLKAYRLSSVYVRKRSNFRNVILTIAGIVLISCAQGLYWFHNQARSFVLLEEAVPQIELSFIYEEYRTPRVVLKTIDREHQLSSQIVPLAHDRFQLSAEVVKWGRLFEVFGLKDCYQFTGIYYVSENSAPNLLHLQPDYDLNGGPSGLRSLIESFQGFIPAKVTTMVTPVIVADPERDYVIELSEDSLFFRQGIDNPPTADYSK